MNMSISCLGLSVHVKRVIDGDTFETIDGERVRLIGINAPEISDIFGKESKDYLSNLINGKLIDLRKDNKSNDRDRYNRLLRYVYLNEIDINKTMIIEGYAFAYLKFKFDKSESYENAQRIAQNNNYGIWANNNFRNVEENNSSTKKYFIIFILVIMSVIGCYYYFSN